MHRKISPLSLKGVILILLFGSSCNQQAQTPPLYQASPAGIIQGIRGANPYPSIGSIPLPPGYARVASEKNSFGQWLRTVTLKKDRTVYLFDGSRKQNQDAQFAVLNVSVGHTDLQQCADAVMRLRAEFLYAQKDFSGIDFSTSQGTHLNFRQWADGARVRLKDNQLIPYSLPASNQPCDNLACFTSYLQTVFSYCGTLSLEKQLLPVPRFRDIRTGDVLIRGGSPGHAMLVVDMAEDKRGGKIYLLAQSYMPAQDIHIVKNINNVSLSPWYQADDQEVIYTPEWTFHPYQLRTWPKMPGN